VVNGRKVGHTATVGGALCAIPRYKDTSYWWPAQQQFIAALGAWYAALPAELRAILKAIFFGVGIDGETQATKNGVVDPSGARFADLCRASIEWYDEAFPDLPLFMACAPGQGRMELTKLCYERHIGAKHNGLQNDVDSSRGYTWTKNPNGDSLDEQVWYGLWDHMRWALREGMPVWIESAHDVSAPQRELAKYHALHFQPVGIDLHSDWLLHVDGPYLDFMRQQMGRTASNAPAAWYCLREKEYPYLEETWSDGIKRGWSGHTGDFCQFISMADVADAAAVYGLGPSGTPGNRVCRVVKTATFQIDAEFAEPPYDLSVTWLQEPGKTLWVDDSASSQMVESAGDGAWATTELTVKSRTFTLRGGCAVHLIVATPAVEPPDPPTPPEPDFDSAVLWAGINGAQAAIDDARREVYQCDVGIGAASQAIAEAARALQTAVAQHEEDSARAVKAMETLDVATGALADMRAELEKSTE
jgi:hypothetical protein